MDRAGRCYVAGTGPLPAVRGRKVRTNGGFQLAVPDRGFQVESHRESMTAASV